MEIRRDYFPGLLFVELFIEHQTEVNGLVKTDNKIKEKSRKTAIL